MKLYHLKKIRIAVSLIFFAALLFIFLNLELPFFKQTGNVVLHLQLFPSILHFLAVFFTISALGFLLVILLTLLFGRVYCSSICPLGTLMDMVSALARQFRKKRQRRFQFSSNRKRILRYTILGATLLLWISGSLFLLNLLDPYSNFGKISTSFFQPAYMWLQNTLVFTLERFDIFTLRPLSFHTLPWDVMIVSLAIFLVIVIMAAWRGRIFCNTICPAGSLLGLIASKAYYRIAFTEEACTMCKKCEWVCKAECLDSQSKTVDKSRCVSCFNCFSSCPNHGLYYTHIPLTTRTNTGQGAAANPQNVEKRNFLLTLTAGLLSIPLLKREAFPQGTDTQRPGMIPHGNRLPVTPPGSLSHENFNNHCIACYRCVGACPTKVIVPAFFDFGLEGFMQPKLDFEKSFCNFDCVECTSVCPTGAIRKQTVEEKQQIRIGVARFLSESCIVTVDGTDCGACSEHCPTKAVQMVPYRDGLFIPQVTPRYCVGCGACEFACPTIPYKAIYVTGVSKHETAQTIDHTEGPREDDTDEFPF